MENYKLSIKTVCEHFWELEKEEKLFNHSIMGVKFWQLIRFKVFGEITNKLGLLDHAHSKKNNLNHKIIQMPNMVINSIIKNPNIGTYDKEILIFDHPRKVKTDGVYVDIYTKYFIESLSEKEYEVVETPYLGNHLTNKKDKNRKYDDAISLIGISKKLFIKNKLYKNDIIKLKKIEESIENKFHIKIRLINRTEKAISNFKFRYKSYMKLFKKRNVSKVYLVVSYGREPLIAAAKACDVEVIEFQHGVITPYHIAYSFPHIQHKLAYFPDKILLFGEYWKESTQFPQGVELEVYGFPYLNDKIKTYKSVKKKKKQILFLSQGTIGSGLSEYAYQIARRLPDHEFIYKLHPGEYDRWRNEYIYLENASNLNNFKVIDNNEINLYSLFAESEFQIGVYSTAIFEGLTLNCNTILFDLPGIEYMHDLIEQNIVEVAEDTNEAIYFIENYELKKFPRDYFFKMNKN